MKIFNYKLNILLFVMTIGLMLSCKKQDSFPKPQPSTFTATLEGAVTSVPATGGKVNIVIRAGADGWWVSTEQASLLTIGRTYGSGDFTLPITIKANTSGVSRVISLKVNPTFNLPAVTFNINQEK